MKETDKKDKSHLDKYFGILKGSKALNDLRKNLKKNRMQADATRSSTL